VGGVEGARVDAERRRVEFEARALTLFDLSATQGNAEAYVQLGDFYYYKVYTINTICVYIYN
jgi:TPR repeat protein